MRELMAIGRNGWLHIARESSRSDIVTRVVERITERFWLLARYPYLDRARDEHLRPGLRKVSRLRITSSSLASCKKTWC
jgi:hypothetical protein